MALCVMMITKIVRLLQLDHPTVLMVSAANQALVVNIATMMELTLAVNLQTVQEMDFKIFLQMVKTTNYLLFAQVLVTRKLVVLVMMTKIWI